MLKTYYDQYFKNANMVMKLIIVNIAVFLLVNILSIFTKLSGLDAGGNSIVHWLSASSDFGAMLFRPWSIVTYQFTQEGLWHIAINMLILNFFGTTFGSTLGDKRLLPLYLMGGFFGWLLFALIFNLSPLFPSGDNQIIGASAAVMTIVAATATYLPNYKVRVLMFTVSLKWLAIFYIAFDLASVSNLGPNIGGHLSHLGGAAFGFVYALQLKKGKDIVMPFANFLNRLFSAKPKPRYKTKMKAHRNPRTQTKKSNAASVNEVDQEEIDRILDKISKSGYDSLSSREKQTLFKAGNN